MNTNDTKIKPIKIMSKLILLIKPLIFYLLVAVIFGVLGFLCAIFIPILGTLGVLKIVDEIYIPLSLKMIFVTLILMGIFRGIFRYTEQACNHYIAFKILAVIRDKVFSALRKLCPAKLENKEKRNLISLITSDVEFLEVFYAHTISPIAIAIIVSTIMFIFIWNISPILALISACAYIFVGIIVPVYNTKRINNLGLTYRNVSGNLNTQFLESLQGLQELIQYDKTAEQNIKINESTRRLSSLQSLLKGKEIFSRNLTDGFILLFNLIMILASLYLYSISRITFSDMCLSVVALLSSYGPVIALSNLSNSLTQTLASGERVLSLLNETPITEDKLNGIDVNVKEIDRKNVTFAYDNIKILDNVSLKAESNKITGILGKSGCGKSTLLKLIMRFWDKDNGKILLSGTEIENINTKSLRDNESYCTQETFLFNDTIGNNIRIGKHNATKDEIIEAAKLASIHDFINELPEKYDTPIGELGERLSDGEKQRIGIARSFLSNSSVMLLDEPTSNLDSLNEAIILKSIYNAKDKTVILISHRKSTLGIADKIYSLESNRKS